MSSANTERTQEAALHDEGVKQQRDTPTFRKVLYPGRNKVEFYVQWNLSDRTWEPFNNVKLLTALDDYFAFKLHGVKRCQGFPKKARHKQDLCGLSKIERKKLQENVGDQRQVDRRPFETPLQYATDLHSITGNPLATKLEPPQERVSAVYTASDTIDPGKISACGKVRTEEDAQASTENGYCDLSPENIDVTNSNPTVGNFSAAGQRFMTLSDRLSVESSEN
ncbi:hypothetical protein C8R45DRAFT_946071 [Mycena sanguinolenta]|nr:hypothetical protein C8R45DRAFT_946071 [Mycena sanguinolenta]